MLRLRVSSQVDLALKRATALVAGERFEAGVFAAVRDEVGRLTEGFVAMATYVRFLACNRRMVRSGNNVTYDNTVS